MTLIKEPKKLKMKVTEMKYSVKSFTAVLLALVVLSLISCMSYEKDKECFKKEKCKNITLINMLEAAVTINYENRVDKLDEGEKVTLSVSEKEFSARLSFKFREDLKPAVFILSDKDNKFLLCAEGKKSLTLADKNINGKLTCYRQDFMISEHPARVVTVVSGDGNTLEILFLKASGSNRILQSGEPQK